jgi:hypothetical protein
MRTTTVLERRLQLSAAMVLTGLTVEAVSLRWQHPTSFLLFMFAGGAAIAAGLVLFLISIVSLPKGANDA